MSIARPGMSRSDADYLRDNVRLHKCDECEAEFFQSSGRLLRADKLTCSDRCRKRRQRRLAAL